MGELVGLDNWITREPDWPDERDPCPECEKLGDDFFPCSVCGGPIVCEKCDPCCPKESPDAAR